MKRASATDTGAEHRGYERRKEYIGAAVLNDVLPEKPTGPSDRLALLGVLFFAFCGIYFLVQGNAHVAAVGVVTFVAVALDEAVRRADGAMNSGKIDALTRQGEIWSRSTRRSSWIGISLLAVGVVGGLAFLSALGSIDYSGFQRRNFMLFGAIFAYMICRGCWATVRPFFSIGVIVSRSGVTITNLFRRRREFAWSELAYASASSKRFGVATRAGEVLAWNARWLRSDPTLVAEIVAQCIEDPGARARLGDETVDVMLAQERWNHRYDPASRFSGRGVEDGVER